MGDATSIEWTDATWNPIGGCSIASPGCQPCYAMQLAGTRLKHHPLYAGTTSLVKGRPVFNGTMTAAAEDQDVWSWPLRWRGAKEPKLGAGRPSLIFTGDMSDLFHKSRSRDVIDKTVGALVHSKHIGQLLTKRSNAMMRYFLAMFGPGDAWRRIGPDATPDKTFVPKLWLGISAERQREFDERWPHLQILAALGFTIFVSYEPAMGPLKLPRSFLAYGRRAQVIAGGVSGRQADRCGAPHPDWFRAVRDQCADAGVAFFLKQWGEWAPCDEDAPGAELIGVDPEVAEHDCAFDHSAAAWMSRVGKKAAGALLDGRAHREFPQ